MPTNVRRCIAVVAVVAVGSVYILGLLACQNEAGGRIPTPKMAKNPPVPTELQTRGAKEGVSYSQVTTGQYRGEEEARSHHCISQDPPIHKGFWELAYTSAYQAVGRHYEARYMDLDGNIWEGGYLDPTKIESVEVHSASFGGLRGGRRVLSLQLRLWIGTHGGFFYRHGAEGYMDEETCEIIYFRSW